VRELRVLGDAFNEMAKNLKERSLLLEARIRELSALRDMEGAVLQRLEEDIHATAGEKFNIQSSQQLGRILFEKLRLKSELSDYYFNLGEVCLFEKEYHKALDYYLMGLKIDRGQNNKMSLACDYNMIGELYVEMDNIAKAEEYFNHSVEVAKQINALPELASAYQNLGILYKKLGRKNKARDNLRQAQEIYGLIDNAKYQEIKKELLDLSSGI